MDRWKRSMDRGRCEHATFRVKVMPIGAGKKIAYCLECGRSGPVRGNSAEALTALRERRKDPAYRNGWGDGRFGLIETFLENPNLAGWAGHNERLAYYRGHREGRRVRETLAHKDST